MTYSYDSASIVEQLKSILPEISIAVPSLKKKTAAGELEGPCPKCGGKDRFFIRSDGSFYCRGCNASGGDKIDFHKWIENTDIKGLASSHLIISSPGRQKKDRAEAITANIVASYPYRDETGNVLSCCVRFEEPGRDKSFRQWQLKGQDWISNVKGVRRILYNLPEVIEADNIIITEGEKDCDNLKALGYVATTNPNGSGNWKPEFTPFMKGKHIAIFADNDEPGQKHLQSLISHLTGVAASIRVVSLPGLKHKGDVSDWIEAGGTREQLAKFIKDSTPLNGTMPAIKLPPKKERPKFKLLKLSEIEFKAPEWLIKPLMEKDALSLIFGDPACGKSFFAIDVTCSIATGKDFHGMKVSQGPVVYIAGEGQNGLKRRFTAWSIRHHQSLDDAPIFISLMPGSLCDEEETDLIVEAVKQVATEHDSPALVVIDTVARNFGPGDENSTKDMNAFVHSLDRIKSICGSTVMLIHHTGHSDKSRSRGSMALKGALDAEYRLEKDDQKVIRVTSTKMKDAPDPDPIAFRLATVELPFKDEDGNPVTSAILDDTAYLPPAVQGKKGRGKWQTVAVEVLENLYEEHADKLEAGGYDPDQAKVSTVDWRTACFNAGMSRQTFNKIKDTLQDSHGIKINEPYVYL